MQLEVKLATQKRSREDTYVGDRPYSRRPMQNEGGGMGMGMGMGNMGMGGGAGGMNNVGGMNNMAGMGNMGGMGGMGGQQQPGGFDPFAMAQFFKQVSHLSRRVRSCNSSHCPDGLGSV